MTTSKLHANLLSQISESLPSIEVATNIRPDWLITDIGQRLELDIYLPTISIAVEINGMQHYEFTPFFHATYDDFKSQLQRDNAKASLCLQNNVHLLEVYDNDSASNALLYIRDCALDKDAHIKRAINIGKNIQANSGSLSHQIKRYNITGKDVDFQKAFKKFKHLQTQIRVLARDNYSLFNSIDDAIIRGCFNALEKFQKVSRRHQRG